MNKGVREEIEKLKKEKNAVILAHNYQILELQEIADFVGDSLELSRAAANTDAEILIFCGVDFMAETASILNPDKKVIIPSKSAICPMAAQLSPGMIRKAKERGIPFITYVNSSAECKAEADVCCTSSNAAQIAKALEFDEIFLGPDANLAKFAEERSGKKVIPIPADGYCYVHKAFEDKDVEEARRLYPNAEIVVHPECNTVVQAKADYVGSTSQMMRYVGESLSNQFVIGTEIGLIERLKHDYPEKKFYPLKESVCLEMKMNTPEKLLNALKNEEFVVKVPEDVAKRAFKSVNRMLEIL